MMRPLIAALLLTLARPAAAQPVLWHVMLDTATGTCSRVTDPPKGANWRELGVFHTFREAGLFEWKSRPLCRHAAIFG